MTKKTFDNIGVNALGHLTFADFDAVALAQKYGTPLYLLDENKIRERCRLYKSAMKRYFGESSMPLFASKSLCFKHIYEIMRDEEMGIDVVSSGELFTAVKAGFPLEKAYFHGNNKTDFDIAFAMDNGIGHFVCDNATELDVIDREAQKRGIRQRVILRLSPGIDPHTHEKISTGSVDSKFGVAIETGQAFALTKFALGKKNVILEGFHSHIGSQIFDCEPFIDASEMMIRFIVQVKNELGYEADVLNLGGGMGVPYTEDDPEIDYAENIRVIAKHVKNECEKSGITMPKILMEPGRSIVADAGATLYTVGGRKEIPGFKNYVSVDGGMPDNPRYTLYESKYTIINAERAGALKDYSCTIAGRCCESGDLIQENVMMARPERGDTLAVLTTGAYNYSMASNYNAICKPPIVMLNGDKDYIAVRRETFEDMIACQT